MVTKTALNSGRHAWMIVVMRRRREGILVIDLSGRITRSVRSMLTLIDEPAISRIPAETIIKSIIFHGLWKNPLGCPHRPNATMRTTVSTVKKIEKIVDRFASSFPSSELGGSSKGSSMVSMRELMRISSSTPGDHHFHSNTEIAARRRGFLRVKHQKACGMYRLRFGHCTLIFCACVFSLICVCHTVCACT
jgi:hypothetical protein